MRDYESEFDAMFGIGTGDKEIPREPSATMRATTDKLHEIYTALIQSGFDPGLALYITCQLMGRAVFGA